MENHPQRDLIWQELHARPYVRFSAPAHVFHFAFLTGEETGPASVAQRARLRERLGTRDGLRNRATRHPCCLDRRTGPAGSRLGTA
ncbi:MAG: DUF3422 family protein [Chthoniobacterales bacterium]|nr:DUF3422 family protein [Chthoniobacterales bacterium]